VLSALQAAMDPTAAGLIAGTIHHFAVQYPNQASLVNTVYAFSLINTIYVVLLLRPENTILFQAIGRLIKDFFVFNSVYVEVYEDDSNCINVYLQFFSRLYTMYILDITEFLRNFGTEQRIGLFGRMLSSVCHTRCWKNNIVN
jgi:hypothetical protein